jgi:hypothetical protein
MPRIRQAKQFGGVQADFLVSAKIFPVAVLMSDQQTEVKS